MAINGNNIIITLNGHAIAGTRSNEIQSNAETIEIATATNQSWKSFIAGRKSWSFTVGFLLLANTDYNKLLNVGTEYNVVIKGRGNNSGASGTAILTDCKITATRGTLATGSFSFVGSGPLTI